MRLRASADLFDVSENADLDTVLKRHQQMQSAMADDFLRLTRSLKQNVSAAGVVIRQDNTVWNG